MEENDFISQVLRKSARVGPSPTTLAFANRMGQTESLPKGIKYQG